MFPGGVHHDLFVKVRHPAQGVGLEAVPNEFVGIEVRRVGRQVEEPQAAGRRSDESFNPFRLVRRMAVDDQIDRPQRSLDQSFEEVNECVGPHAAFDDHESEGSPRADG